MAAAAARPTISIWQVTAMATLTHLIWLLFVPFHALTAPIENAPADRYPIDSKRNFMGERPIENRIGLRHLNGRRRVRRALIGKIPGDRGIEEQRSITRHSAVQRDERELDMSPADI